jgi:glucokinase
MALRGGIDLGGTKIEAVVVDDTNTILGQARLATPTEDGPPAVVHELGAAMREAASAAGVELASLAGVGIGAPGEVDAAAGTLARAGNLPDWEAVYPIASELGRDLGIPVRIGNDVRVAVNAERVLGAGRTYVSFLGVWWGTGVGGGLVLDGKLWLGRGSAGELGHVVVKLGGRRCPCGRRGCLEAYAGRAAMERTARKAEEAGTKTKLFSIMKKRGRTRLTSGVWAAALEEEDQLAHELIGEALEALGAGVASVQNLVDVDAIVVGGGLGTRLGAPYVERIALAAQPHLFVDDRPPAFVLGELGDNAGGLGAALLVSA